MTSTSTTQSRGEKWSRREDDDQVLREIRDSMQTNTQILSQPVATTPSSAREPFINMADTLRLMDEAKYEEAKKKIVPLLLEVTKPHEKTSGGIQDKVSPGTMKSVGASTTTTSEMWQPHPQDWVRQPPPTRMGVWGSASLEYMAKYHATVGRTLPAQVSVAMFPGLHYAAPRPAFTPTLASSATLRETTEQTSVHRTTVQCNGSMNIFGGVTE